MKIKIAAIISFVCAGGLLIVLIFVFVKEPHEIFSRTDEMVAFVTMLALSISTLFYVKWTSFGNKKVIELEKIDYENQLLKKKIEQKELKKSLEN